MNQQEDRQATLTAALLVGFTVTCNKCGSVDVQVDNGLRYHPECGPWGEVELVCRQCHQRCKISECEQ